MSDRRRTRGDEAIDAPVRAPMAPGRASASARLFPGAQLLRKARDANGVADGADAAVSRAASSTGAPLPRDVRTRFESSLGADLSAVRLHTAAPSAEAAGAVGAKAYTVGNDIHFAAGQYAPADPFGLHLLAHEVAHTQQQAGGAPARQHKLEVSSAGDALEVDADRAADAMVRGAAYGVSTAAPQLQRDPAAPDAAAQEGPGMQALRQLAANGLPAPGAVADLARRYPDEGHDIYVFLQGTFGDAYVASVTQAAQVKASDVPHPKDAGAAAKPGGQPRGTALPDARTKNPADKLTLSAQELDFERAIRPPAAWLRFTPPAELDAGARGSRSIGGVTDLDPAPDDLAADKQTTQVDGSRTLQSHLDTTSQGVTTTTDAYKQIGPTKALTAQEKATELARYKKAIVDELDAEAKRLPELETGSVDSDAAVDHRTQLRAQGISMPRGFDHDAEVERIAALKKQAQDATDVDSLIGIVVKNKLVVKPPERLIAANVTTRTQGLSGAGAITGDSIYQNNTKQTIVYVAPDGSTTTDTESKNRSFGLNKGVDISNSHTVTKPDDEDPSKTSKTTTKYGVTGGVTDPLQVGASKTTASSDGSGSEKALGAKFGDGTAAVTASSKTTKADNTSVATSGSVGLTQDKDGTGVAASADRRTDVSGSKKYVSGSYFSTDGSVKVLVKQNADGSVVLTFTCAVKIKAGLHGGKRAPDDPVESGTDWSAGGSAGITHSRVVVRSRTVTKDNGEALLEKLDKLKPFGVEAAATAYSSVFGAPISDLCYGVPEAGDGESVNLVTEDGVGADAKANVSGGDGKNARTGIGADVNAGAAVITGAGETNLNGRLTRRILTGSRVNYGGNASVSEGPASMKAGASHGEEKRLTYIFEVDAKDANMVAAVRALVAPEDCEAFKKDHPETFRGVIVGESESNGTSVGMGVGPLSADGGTTKTVDGDVVEGQHIEYGPDGKPIVKHDLSGTYTGSQQNNESVSVGGIKLAQSQQTTTAKGNVDSDGQTSLDLTSDSSSSDVTKAVPKNAKTIGDMRTADKATMVATQGLWGSIKKLAEDVGETSTIGAHFDPASFDALVARAGDHASWMNAAQRAPKLWLDYKTEWSHLGYALANPQPPADWIAKDDSENHRAAMQLYRIKAFASFIAETGEAGREGIQVLRGGYGSTENALGIDVSFPPSLQSERPNFDDACSKVEHLHQNLDPFIQAGNADGGNAFLDALLAQLHDLHTKIEKAPDHENMTVAIRAGAGIAKMETKVRAAKARFAPAVAAKKVELLDAPTGPTAAEIQSKQAHDAAAARLADTEGKQKELQARAANNELPAAGDKAGMKKWEKQQDKLNDEADKLNNENYARSNAEAEAKEAEEKAKRQAEADAAKAKALDRIPGQEDVVKDAARKTTAAIVSLNDAATSTFSGGSVSDRYMSACSVIKEWKDQWATLTSLYGDGGVAEGDRKTNLAPALNGYTRKLLDDAASNWRTSDSEKSMIGDVRSRLS